MDLFKVFKPKLNDKLKKIHPSKRCILIDSEIPKDWDKIETSYIAVYKNEVKQHLYLPVSNLYEFKKRLNNINKGFIKI